VFDLYDTLLYPKGMMQPLDIQAIINSFTGLGYKTNNMPEFIQLIRKYSHKSPYAQLYSILYDPAMTSFVKTLTNWHDIDKLYNNYEIQQNELLYNQDYYIIDRNLKTMLNTIKNQGLANISAITRLNWTSSSIMANQLEYHNIYLDKIVSGVNLDKGLEKIMMKFNNQSDNIIYVTTNYKPKYTNYPNTYTVGLSTTYTRPDLYLAGSDYVIDHICQLPYVIQKLNCDL
jgi:hypothetical protein